jgi:methyltransferase-like protein
VGSSVGTTVISPATVNASVNAYFQYPYYPYAYCTNQNSSTIITKSGATITLTFNDTTDYNTYKTQYTNAANSPYITNYTGDSTNLNYYKYFNLGILSGITDIDTYQINLTDNTLTITSTCSGDYDPLSDADFSLGLSIVYDVVCGV